MVHVWKKEKKKLGTFVGFKLLGCYIYNEECLSLYISKFEWYNGPCLGVKKSWVLLLGRGLGLVFPVHETRCDATARQFLNNPFSSILDFLDFCNVHFWFVLPCILSVYLGVSLFLISTNLYYLSKIFFWTMTASYRVQCTEH